ncbi:hypothetical protein PUN28_001907 [Cardiocondyla obscurior]|uniref:Uncharacterized protein n=1 Tax=Cardiocondyla obscurior TaxID=286306 RepID=A0AAW2GRN8_9HYME
MIEEAFVGVFFFLLLLHFRLRFLIIDLYIIAYNIAALSKVEQTMPRVSLLSRPSTPALSKRLPPSNSEVKSCSSPRVPFKPRESSVKSGSSSSTMLLPLPFWLPELRMYSPVKKRTNVSGV